MNKRFTQNITSIDIGSQKNESLSILRVFATLAVIGIHLNVNLINLFPFASTQGSIVYYWGILLRWCVPAFVILSGFLVDVNTAANNANGFIQKRMGRIVYPILFWCTAYFVFDIVINKIPFSFPFLWDTIWFCFQHFHLYFLFLIAGLYFVTPMLAWVVLRLSNGYFYSLLALTFLLPVLMYHVQFYFNVPGASLNVFTQWLPYVGYFLMGMAIRNKIPLPFFKILFLSAIILICNWIFLLWVSPINNTDYTFFTSYQHIGTTALSLLITIPFFMFPSVPSKLGALSNQIESDTLGIYLIHPMILAIGFSKKINLGLNHVFEVSIAFIPVVVLIVFVLSLLLVRIIKKIPHIKLIVG